MSVDYEEGRRLLAEVNAATVDEVTNNAQYNAATRELSRFMLTHAEALLNPDSASPSPAPEGEVEAVARALYDATPFKETAGGYDQQSDTYKRMCELLARAALSAMRQRAAMDDLLRMDGELYDVPERAAPALSEVDMLNLRHYRKRHREWQKTGPGDRYEQHDAIGVLLSLIDKLTEAG